MGIPKRFIFYAATLATVTVGVRVAESEVFPSALVLGEGYAVMSLSRYEWPTIGEKVRVVGKVTSFSSPLGDVPVPGTSLEYTYILENLTVIRYGFWDDFQNNRGGQFIDCEAGRISIYQDTSPDADYSNSASFSDGELVLSGDYSTFSILTGNGNGRSQSGSFAFTDGSWFHQFSNGSNAVAGYSSGYFDFYGLPQAVQDLGYAARLNSELTIDTTVPAQATTWSRIKLLRGL